MRNCLMVVGWAPGWPPPMAPITWPITPWIMLRTPWSVSLVAPGPWSPPIMARSMSALAPALGGVEIRRGILLARLPGADLTVLVVCLRVLATDLG